MCSTELKYISLTLIAEHGASVSPGSGQVQDMEVTRSKEGHQVGGCLNFTFLASAVAEAWIASDLGGDEYVMLRMRPDALRKLKPLDKAIKREEMMGISRIPEIEDKLKGIEKEGKDTDPDQSPEKTDHLGALPFDRVYKPLRGFPYRIQGVRKPF